MEKGYQSTGCEDREAVEHALKRYVKDKGRKDDQLLFANDDGMTSVLRKVLRKSKERSQVKGFEFDLTKAGLIALAVNQGMSCAISRLQFSTEKSTSGRRHPFAPSADRIDNKKGCTFENIRLVRSMVNLARGDFSDDEFFLMCASVAASGGKLTVT